MARRSHLVGLLAGFAVAAAAWSTLFALQYGHPSHASRWAAELYRDDVLVQSALTAPERLTLVGNQWALAKAAKIAIDQFFAMLEGFRAESDRAVVAAITERLYWMNTHLLEAAAEPLFERFVDGFFRPHFSALGWEPRGSETADDRLRRATAIAALG